MSATTVEILRFDPQSPRTGDLFAALRASASRANVRVTQTRRYAGDSDWLMLWGPGGLDRFDAIRQQRARGARVICWDLAYWDRYRKLRVSIDAAHPQAWVMRRDWPTDRLTADRVTITDTWNPRGPIVVAGLGQKARVQYGAAVVDAWEAEMVKACAARVGRPVWYRSKRNDLPVPPYAIAAPPGEIERVLAGAALVITWHSNVAVDAIRAGIPVICRDGAAAAVCGSTLPDALPSPLATEVRDRFLANLAWFQWAPAEASQCWRFLAEILS